ncbi:MAG: hypothetical protein JWO86_7187 [Myxococcaceae bacterium]|nr:hypothetical protein [Myxococcaceae bacterium]MEA2750175.1 hypothetical protein [Myxococcales bacterium]
MQSLTTRGRSTRARGASLVELSLLLVAIVVGSVAGFRAIGHSASRAFADGTTALGGADQREAQLTVGLPAPEKSQRP